MGVLAGLESVIDVFAHPGGIVIERHTSTIVDGYPSGDGSPTLIPVPIASVQIVEGRDLLVLEEGDRTKEVIRVSCKVVIRTAKAGTTEQADIVRYIPGGEGGTIRYVTKKSEDLISQSGHYTVWCVRLGEQ